MILNTIFEVFVNNILTKPEFFVGILVLIGYLLLGKTIHEAFAGFVKANLPPGSAKYACHSGNAGLCRCHPDRSEFHM